MPLEQHIVCILQSKHQQILKMTDMNREAVHRPIEALGSANVLARWHPEYTSHLSGIHRLFINWHVQDRYHDYYYY